MYYFSALNKFSNQFIPKIYENIFKALRNRNAFFDILLLQDDITRKTFHRLSTKF